MDNNSDRCGKRCAGARWAFLAVSLAIVLMVGTARAADFVIVVDVSGSMGGIISGRDTRLRIAVVQEALRQYLHALPTGSRVDLIAFNSGIVSEQEVVLKEQQDLDRALAWADGLKKEVSKTTYLWTTLRHALETASKYSQEDAGQPVTVRVLTDGEDNQGVTTLDQVLQEFLPVLDGEKIRSNLVLLGDMELKTKLSLPDGAFETTKNPTWEVLFPPIVLWTPAEPKIGEQVRLFENTAQAIYKDYEWAVDGTAVGKEKVLTWQFKEPRSYRVTLKVTGLQGTKSSATVIVKAKDRDKLVVDFVASTAQPEPGQEVKFVGRCSGQGTSFVWFVNSTQVATSQDLNYRFEKEGKFEVKLAASDTAGGSGVCAQTVEVKEQALTAGIKGATEVVSGRVEQFVGEIKGPCASVEWHFGDGATSSERNPQHRFECADSEFKDYTVGLRAVSPLGKAVVSAPHTVRVWAEKKAPAPQAMFRILTQNPKVGDPIQLVDETTGPVDAVQWDIDGEPKGTARNPEVRVGTPGEKTVRMIVRGPGGESVATKKIAVSPRYTQPVAWCRASTLSGAAPLTVQFTSRITGDYKSLRWTFGDGRSSTESNPRHTFETASDYAVSLTVSPVDDTQSDSEQRVFIRATKPWPAWTKAAAVAALCLALVGTGVGWAYLRRRRALRLPVYYWVEGAPACRTVMLTDADETVELQPVAPIRIRRDGTTQNLTVEPLEGAALFASGGQEVTTLRVGSGLRVTVRDTGGLTRAIAIAIRQKPRRPAPAADGCEVQPEDGVCGLHEQNGNVPSPSGSDEFDWGFDATSANRG